ncbi:MAG: acetylornithine deacetylase [Phycisphaeraceae bacterium]
MSKDIPTSLQETLQQLVRIDSVNSELSGRPCAEAEAVAWVERVAQAWGFPSRRLPVPGHAEQLLVMLEADPGLPWLLFDSHLDTVAVEGMTIDPFGGVCREGRIYGRGACDTKGTAAAMLWALKQYQGEQNKTHNIALLLSVDEEVGMHGITHFIRHDVPSLGWTPAAVIVGEPTELHPVVAHNGLIRWKVTTHGLAAHSSVPHMGRSAISMMIRIVHAIESRYIPSLSAHHDLTGPAVCSVNTIHGGAAANIIPDQCVINVDRRIVPGEAINQIKNDFANLLAQVREEHEELTYEVQTVVTHPPLVSDQNESLIGCVKTSLRAMGLPAVCVGAPYATHAGYFSQAGIPTIVLGPGEAHKAHTRDEYISTDQLERGAELYLRLMRSRIA